MSFPLECVGPVCDAFILRTKDLLIALEQNPSNHGLLTRAHFSILTLYLMVQKNYDAVLYICQTLAKPDNSFFKVTFKFLLRRRRAIEDSSAEVTRLLCECIGAILKCKSTTVNDYALQEILKSLQFMQSTSTVQVVHPSIMDIVVSALHQLCTEWSAQHKATQQKALTLLKWLLNIDSLQTITSIMSKSLIVQLHLLVNHESPLSREVALDSEQVKFLLTSLSSVSSDHVAFHCTKKVMQAVDYLVRYAPNKEALIDGGILDHLADIVEGGCSEQQYATELICFIMDEPELNIQHEQPAQPSCNNSYFAASELSTDVESFCSDYQASEVVKILLPLALNCFRDFMSACGQHQEQDASSQLMYTSTLIQLVRNVFDQEDSDDQIRITDIIAHLPEVSSSLIAMLWGSSVVLPLDPFQLPPTTWIGTFFEIQNCLIQWTDLSERFCNALLEAGLIHFVDTEFGRLKEVVLNLTRLPHHDLLINQVHSVMAILYNCVQKAICLPTILKTIHADDSLTAFTLSPNFDIKVLSKFILSFLLPLLRNEHQELLVLKLDEAKYLLDNLNNASQSLDLIASGYSASELLQVLLNFSKHPKNHLALMDVQVHNVVEKYIRSSDSNFQRLSLQIVWNFLSFDVREKYLRLTDSCDVIRNMAVDVQIQSLHQSVLFLLKKQEDADVSDILTYAKACFQYQKYLDCIDSTDRIQTMSKSSLNKIVVNEARLLKGKSLFYTYQRDQNLFRKCRGSLSVKEAENLKQQCYQKTRECIVILGSLYDCGDLDEDGSKLLDFAMIDYMRETNCLNSCRRCLLCRNKAVLRRSHLFSKFILKAIAKDLVVEGDHKVFIPMIGKAVKKSFGEVTFWMFCSNCEEMFCQNGEQQFAEQIHRRVCIDRQVVQSELLLPYGNWLYDFCVGVFFRGLAISDELGIFNAKLDLYELFVGCRQHLLSLSVKQPASTSSESEKASPSNPPNNVALDKIAVSFFVNPLVNASRSSLQLSCLNWVLKAPAVFVSPVTLDTAILSHVSEQLFFLVHFDCLNILIQWQPLPSANVPALPTVMPHGGELLIPEEHRRWQIIPSGIWKLFSALCKAKDDFNRVSKSEMGSGMHQKVARNKPGFVYPPKTTIFLDEPFTVSCLPSTFSIITSESNEVVIKVPQDHHVLMCATREWGYTQKITFYVTGCATRLYLVIVLQLPGFIIVDGISLDPLTLTVSLPFLDKKCIRNHPLVLTVLHNLLTNVQEITTFLQIQNQLS